MNESNGIGMLSDWVIALVGGRTVLGKRASDTGDRLEPVYDFGVQVEPSREGLQRHFVVIPFMWLASIEALRIPADCAKIYVSDLSKDEKANILKAIKGAEEFVRKMRAAESGILIANAMPVKP